MPNHGTATCPDCRHSIQYPLQHQGKRAKCPKCQASVRLAPSAAVPPPPPVVEPEPDAVIPEQIVIQTGRRASRKKAPTTPSSADAPGGIELPFPVKTAGGIFLPWWVFLAGGLLLALAVFFAIQFGRPQTVQDVLRRAAAASNSQSSRQFRVDVEGGVCDRNQFLELKVHNRDRKTIVSMSAILMFAAKDREVPFAAEPLEMGFSGGIEPGETFELRERLRPRNALETHDLYQGTLEGQGPFIQVVSITTTDERHPGPDQRFPLSVIQTERSNFTEESLMGREPRDDNAAPPQLDSPEAIRDYFSRPPPGFGD